MYPHHAQIEELFDVIIAVVGLYRSFALSFVGLFWSFKSSMVEQDD